MKVKICGITNLEDALAACEAGADALGFVFAEEAKARGRYIHPEDAHAIIDRVPPYISTVAVCVNETACRLEEYLEFCDRVQLHGEESAAVCQVVGPRAIKAFQTGPDFDPKSILEFPVAAYLIDAFVEGKRGGTGKTADWSAARKAVALGKPIILAGGLNPENVIEAIQAVRPYGVDTAGGVEKEPGKKDHERIRSFIHNAKTSLS